MSPSRACYKRSVFVEVMLSTMTVISRPTESEISSINTYFHRRISNLPEYFCYDAKCVLWEDTNMMTSGTSHKVQLKLSCVYVNFRSKIVLWSLVLFTSQCVSHITDRDTSNIANKTPLQEHEWTLRLNPISTLKLYTLYQHMRNFDLVKMLLWHVWSWGRNVKCYLINEYSSWILLHLYLQGMMNNNQPIKFGKWSWIW